MDAIPTLTRRTVLTTVGAAVLLQNLSGPARAQSAATKLFEAELAKLLAGRTPKESGVKIDAPAIAENGLVVPITVEADSPMTDADHIKTIHVLADGNPLPGVASFHFTPANGRAAASTRMRLAQSQNLVAIAETSGGELRIARAEVKVTIGGCGG